MRKAKHLLMAAVVAMSTLTAGAAPRLAAAELPAAEAAQLADGWYRVVNEQTGQTVGWFRVSGGQIVEVIDNPAYQNETQAQN